MTRHAREVFELEGKTEKEAKKKAAPKAAESERLAVERVIEVENPLVTRRWKRCNVASPCQALSVFAYLA